MVGVNSGDGRGNLTAYATVYDSKQVLQRDRDYSACSLATDAPHGVVRLRRLRDEPPRHVHRLLDVLPDGRHGRLVPPDGLDLEPEQRRPVQLRPAEPLPASGAPLQHRRDGPLRVRRARRRLHAADVQRLRVGRADRPVRQLLRDHHDQLRQPVPAGEQPGRHRLRAGGGRGRRRPSRCTSAGATWRAAAASSRSRTTRSARLPACVARSTTAGATTRRRSTRAARSMRRRSTTS